MFLEMNRECTLKISTIHDLENETINKQRLMYFKQMKEVNEYEVRGEHLLVF
jgi:hypothetical protein